MLKLRTLLFYLALVTTAIVIGIPSMFLWLTPYSFRAPILICFNRISLWSLRLICGVKCEIIGEENIPRDQPFVIMAKHQSTWDAFFLQMFFHPTSTILKKELFRIPVFGWGLAQMKPISIDRSNPKEALRKVKQFGGKRLDEGNNVLVYPEGTRIPIGQSGNYARSGADIALTHDAPVLPVAHNAGSCWPMHTWVKYPGTITVSIGKPIDVKGKNSKQVTLEAKEWMEQEVVRLGPPEYFEQSAQA